MLNTRSQLATSSNTENAIPLSLTRNVNFKTPARSLKPGRVVLNENSVYGHPKTAGFMGRKKKNVLFSTPAENPPLHSCFKTNRMPRFASKSTALAEITNQTPFAKAVVPVTPLASLKSSKSFAIFNDDLVAPSTHRVSLSREKLRLPRSASKNFETPKTKGNYWDVSDASIEGSVMEDASTSGEDYDDVEYAPPTAIDPKYDPGFDMPDYKKVGATLMSLFRITTISDGYEPVSDIDGAALHNQPIIWENLELPDILPNDIFPFLTVETSHSRSFPACSGIPSKSDPPRQSSTKPLSRPMTGKMAGGIAHTRIPSLSKSRVTQAATHTTRPMLTNTTVWGHARIIRDPIKTSDITHTRTTSVPSQNVVTTDSRAISMSRTISGSKSVARLLSSTENKPRMKQTPVPDDIVLSLITDFGNEPLGGEFLFTV